MIVALNIFFVLFSSVMVASAQCVTSGDSTTVSGSGGSQCIDRHATCRVVTNSNAASIMVPHKTADEWSGASGFVPNTQPNVSKSACANCTGTPWGSVVHGYSNTAFESATPLPPAACTSQTRTCTNGTLSGSYTATGCNAGCTGTPWGSVIHGYSNTAFLSSLPAGACTSETRTCTNGNMGGTYTATGCNAGCTGTPWGSVVHGYSGTAYQYSSVCGCASYSQTRSCTDGVMSGSFSFTSCTESCGTSTTGSGAGPATATGSSGGAEL
jgi:hypothetical protein